MRPIAACRPHQPVKLQTGAEIDFVLVIFFSEEEDRFVGLYKQYTEVLGEENLNFACKNLTELKDLINSTFSNFENLGYPIIERDIFWFEKGTDLEWGCYNKWAFSP